MTRKRTPDILGEALQGDFPLALKPALPTRKKNRKKAKPSPMPLEGASEFMPFIRDILVELGPLAKEFIKGTVADALSSAIDIIADQKSEIAQLKTSVCDLELRIGELAGQLNEWIARGIALAIPGNASPSDCGKKELTEMDRSPVQTAIIDKKGKTGQDLETKGKTDLSKETHPAGTQPILPGAETESGHKGVSTSSLAGITTIDNTKESDDSRLAIRKKAEASAEERYRQVLVKTILNMRVKQGLNPVQIANRFENGGLKPLDGKTSWDAEMVKSLVRGKRV